MTDRRRITCHIVCKSADQCLPELRFARSAKSYIIRPLAGKARDVHLQSLGAPRRAVGHKPQRAMAAAGGLHLCAMALLGLHSFTHAQSSSGMASALHLRATSQNYRHSWHERVHTVVSTVVLPTTISTLSAASLPAHCTSNSSSTTRISLSTVVTLSLLHRRK